MPHALHVRTGRGRAALAVGLPLAGLLLGLAPGLADADHGGTPHRPVAARHRLALSAPATVPAAASPRLAPGQAVMDEPVTTD